MRTASGYSGCMGSFSLSASTGVWILKQGCLARNLGMESLSGINGWNQCLEPVAMIFGLELVLSYVE